MPNHRKPLCPRTLEARENLNRMLEAEDARFHRMLFFCFWLPLLLFVSWYAYSTIQCAS